MDDGIKKHSNPVPDIQRKTKIKKPSTLDVSASKRRKIDITPAMQLAAKKIASNDSSPLISLKRREHVGDLRGNSRQKYQTPQLNKQKAPTQIRNLRKWTSDFEDSLDSDELDNAYTFNVRKNIRPIRRTRSSKAISNLVSVIKAVAEGSRQLPHAPLSLQSVSTNSAPQMIQISSRGKVKRGPVAAENKRAAPKKVQPSSPSLLPTENVEKILLPKDSSSSSIDDSNHQVVKTVRMDNQKMVQESRKVAKKSVTFSSTSLSVPEVCANFGLQDVHIDSKTIQRNDYKFDFSLVLPLLRKENPNVN